MGAPARLKQKDELKYRKGSTNESENCRYCVHFIEQFPVYGIGGGDIPLRIEGRCRIMGVQAGKRYNIRPDYKCEAQKFDESKKTW